ncbi:MAG: hypothetical protein ACWGN1_06820 [Desulfobulbales bacterium]
MSPLRLLLIGCLLYILYRLLVGPSRKKGRGLRQDAGGQGTVQDVLVEDPVCHTLIPKGQAVQLHHEKQMYYFCSNKCCEMFLKKKGAEE